MSLLRNLSLPLALLFVSACGGGGGGKGTPQPTFSIASTSVTFSASATNAGPPLPQIVTGSIVNATSDIYLFVVHTNIGVASASVQVTGQTTGQLTIFPRAPAQLGEGTYNDTITLRACLDNACARELSGSPRTINVTYNVNGGIVVSPTAINMSSVEGAPSVATTVSVQNRTGQPNWSASVVYTGPVGGSNWLNVTPASGSSTTPSVSVSGTGTLPPGAYTAILTFSAGAASASIPIVYNVARNLSSDSASVTFTGVTGQGAPPSAKLINVTSSLASTTYTTAITYGPNASGWLAAAGSTAPGVLTVQPTRTDLGPGEFTAAIILTPASGASLTIPVTYYLSTSTLTFTPSAPSFTINGASTVAASFTQRVVTTGDTGAVLNWTASSSEPWLTVTGSGTSGSNATLTLVPAQLTSLSNGPRTAVVTFTYSGPAVNSASRTLDVALNLDLPAVNYVAPYVAYANEPEEVVIRGSGFAQGGLAAVTFGGVQAQSITVRSDTEIRALPPTGLTAGTRADVVIANNLGLDRSRAELVVRSHPNYAYATVVADIGPQNVHVLYDAERDQVFSARAYFQVGNEPASVVTCFRYNSGSGTWSRTTTATFDQLFDIAMSPDGKELLVLTSGFLNRFNPDTFASLGIHAVPNFSGGTAQQLAVTNDGKVLIRDANQAFLLLENRFVPVQFPGNTVGIDMSPDGSRATMGAATNQDDVPLSYYDSSTSTIQTTTAFQYYSPGTLTRLATKSLSGQFVRNADFSLVGELRDGATPSQAVLGDVLAPNGERAYAYDYNYSPGGRVRVWDTRVSTPILPELTPITMPDYPGVVRMVPSPDNRTLFLIGEDRLIVLPLP